VYRLLLGAWFIASLLHACCAAACVLVLAALLPAALL
jgi:hypothetical protein